MSPETLIALIKQALDDISKADKPGDESAHWQLMLWLATFYAWHHPEDSDRLRPFLRWRNNMVDKTKGTRRLPFTEEFARARASAYARAVSIRLRDADAWRRMREALICSGFHPPSDLKNQGPGSGLKDWANNSAKDYSRASRLYQQSILDFNDWTDQQLADNEAYVVFELFDDYLEDPWPINRPPGSLTDSR